MCKKVPAKFGEESSVKADGLCIGCLSQWAEVGRENSNMQGFLHDPVIHAYLISTVPWSEMFDVAAFWDKQSAPGYMASESASLEGKSAIVNQI